MIPLAFMNDKPKFHAGQHVLAPRRLTIGTHYMTNRIQWVERNEVGIVIARGDNRPTRDVGGAYLVRFDGDGPGWQVCLCRENEMQSVNHEVKG